MAAPKLESYVDHSVLLKTSYREAAVTATLRGVDEHGLWLESEELTNELLGAKRPAGSVTPMLFTPFAQLEFVIGALDTNSTVVKE
jgi:hypothetical protein